MKSVLCSVVLGVVSAPVFAEVMCPDLLGACVGEDHVLRVVDRMEDCGPNSDWMQISALKPYTSVRLVDADGFVIHEYEKCVEPQINSSQNPFNIWQNIEIKTNQGYPYHLSPVDGMPANRVDSVYFESNDCSGNAWKVESYCIDCTPSEEFETTNAFVFYVPKTYVYYTPPGEQQIILAGDLANNFIQSAMTRSRMGDFHSMEYECSEYSMSPDTVYHLSPVYINDPSITGVPFVTEADAPTLPLRVEKIPAPRRAAPLASPNP